MRSIAVVCVLAAVLAAPAAQAEQGPSAAFAAFSKVCLPAAEQAVAPRDLALKQGYTRDEHADPGLATLLPLTQLSASFSVPAETGEVHIVSTVAPPPADPTSCAVTVSGDAADFRGRVEQLLVSLGYQRAAAPDTEAVSYLAFAKPGRGGVYRVLGLFNRHPKAEEASLVIMAYRMPS
jgi:hypothetical protein